MYRLMIFFLISYAIPQQLVAGNRIGTWPPGRNNLYFDSYDHEYSEESEDSRRDAILIQPEEVIDIPITPERDYEMLDLTNENNRDDYPDESLRGSRITRNFLEDFINRIEAALGIGGSSSVKPAKPSLHRFVYNVDSSIPSELYKKIQSIMDTISSKTCTIILERKENAAIIFKGAPGCMVEMVGNVIHVGDECFEPQLITRLIFKIFGLCEQILPTPLYKSAESYITKYENEIRREDEDNTECVDKISNCDEWANNGGCHKMMQILVYLCPRTCRLCGDSCTDYSSNCHTNDTVRDCLLNWSQKRYECAHTCGICSDNIPDRCVDMVHDCEWLSKKGYCPKFPKLMKRFCPLSCGYCTPRSCVDNRKDCGELAFAGGCKRIPGLMELHCPKICDFCEGKQKNREYDHAEGCKLDLDYTGKYCFWDPVADGE